VGFLRRSRDHAPGRLSIHYETDLQAFAEASGWICTVSGKVPLLPPRTHTAADGWIFHIMQIALRVIRRTFGTDRRVSPRRSKRRKRVFHMMHSRLRRNKEVRNDFREQWSHVGKAWITRHRWNIAGP